MGNKMPQDRIIRELVTDSSISDIRRIFETHPSGIITAFCDHLSHQENTLRNRKLLAQLLRAGMDVTAVNALFTGDNTNEWPTHLEESFSVVFKPRAQDDGGELENLLCELGKEYEQKLIIITNFGGEAELVNLSHQDETFTVSCNRTKVGKADFEKIAQFLSLIKGRPYRICSTRHIEIPGTNFGKWAMKLIAEKDWRKSDSSVSSENYL